MVSVSVGICTHFNGSTTNEKPSFRNNELVDKEISGTVVDTLKILSNTSLQGYHTKNVSPVYVYKELIDDVYKFLSITMRMHQILWFKLWRFYSLCIRFRSQRMSTF